MTSDTKNYTNSSNSQLPYYFCVSPYAVPMYTAWFVVYLVCFSIFLSVLYILYKKWKKSIQLSHSDVFTLHMILIEMFKVLGFCVIFYIVHNSVPYTGVLVVVAVSTLTRYGQMFFSSLTCVERYVAVVHPITYLRLKKSGGVTIRNVCIGFAWLCSAGLSIVGQNPSLIFYSQFFTLLLSLSSLALVSFCTTAVLRVLIRPGPGEGSQDRKTITQSKRMALTIMAFILGAQFLGIVNFIIFYTLGIIAHIRADLCLLFVNSFWLEMPNSLVLPLLFLHRAKQNHDKPK